MTKKSGSKSTITRRSFLQAGAGLLAFGLSSCKTVSHVVSSRKKPNILFLMSDDLCTALSGFGHPQCKTPNLDKLANRGIKFERAYCQYPVCGPSRTSILTGHYPNATGTLTNRTSGFRGSYPDLVSMPQLFRKNGYYSARVGKLYHMGVPGDMLMGLPGRDDPLSWDQAINIKAPEQHADGIKEDLSPKVKSFGMKFFSVKAKGDDNVHHDGMAAQKAIQLLGQLTDRPFFLAVGMVRPHVPLVAPADYFKPYKPKHMQLPDVPADDLGDVPKSAKTQTNAVKYGMNIKQQRKVLSSYYASVAFMDAQVGKILDELDRLGLSDDTIVVFSSDHGYNLGQHTCWQKLSLWEDSVRVPLIVSVPWMKNSKAESKKVVELIDLYPTLADICGLKPPADLPGTSLRPLIENSDSTGWKEKSAYTVSHQKGESLRTARWRYTVWDKGQAGVELYDHKKDPGEFNNLADEPRYKKLIAKLQKQLEAARMRAAPLPKS
jgi:choline-sulfatase